MKKYSRPRKSSRRRNPRKSSRRRNPRKSSRRRNPRKSSRRRNPRKSSRRGTLRGGAQGKPETPEPLHELRKFLEEKTMQHEKMLREKGEQISPHDPIYHLTRIFVIQQMKDLTDTEKQAFINLGWDRGFE